MSVVVQDIDKGWKKIRKEVKKFHNSYTGVGYYSSVGAAGTPKTNIAARAAVNEYGAVIPVTKKMSNWFLYNFGKPLKKDKRAIIIPKRSFMRKTWNKYKKEAFHKIEIFHDAVLQGKINAKKALSRLGEWYVGATKLTIRGGGFKRNSSLTILRKKSTKPLIDSAEMLNSTTHREFIR